MTHTRGWYVLLYLGALWLGLFLGARYGYSQEAGRTLCDQIRGTVAAIGRQQAESLARANGFTDEQIAIGKRCLQGHHHTTRRTE